MTEEVRLSSDGTWISVRSEGAPSLAEMKQTLARIAELRRIHQVDKVLVDSRARSAQPSVIDIHDGGELLASMLGSSVRVAIVVAELASGHKFFQDVAYLQGSIVAYFQDYDAALRWLQRDTD